MKYWIGLMMVEMKVGFGSLIVDKLKNNKVWWLPRFFLSVTYRSIVSQQTPLGTRGPKNADI